MALRDPNFSATYTVDDIRVYTSDTVTWTLTVTNTSDAQILVDYDLRHPRQLGKESTVDAAGTYGYTGDGSHNGTTDRITLPAAGQGVLTFQYTITETADNVPLTSVAELTEVVGSTIDSQGNTITQSDPTMSVKAPTTYLNRWGGGKTSEAVDPRQAWSSWVFGTDVTAARISDAIAEGKDWLEVLAEVVADEGGGGGGGAGVDLAGTPPVAPDAGDLWVDDTSGVMFYYTGAEWVEITATSSTIDAIPTTQSGTAYTIAAGDHGGTVILSNAAQVTVTIPTDAADDLKDGYQTMLVSSGAGGVTLSTTGITLIGSSPNTTIAQNEGMWLQKTSSANTWIVVGGTS